MCEMIERPAFKSHFRIDVRSAELVVASSEGRVEVLEGRLHPLLVPWLDGTRTASEIAAAAGAPVTALDALFGIALLEEHGLIEEGGGEQDPWRSAFGARLKHPSRAAVHAPVELDPAPLEAALQSLGVSIGHPADLSIVLTGDYLRPGIEQSGAWMPVKAAGTSIWFGPICGGETGVCWECLATRIREWRRADAFLPSRTESDDLRPSPALPPGPLSLALQLAALQAYRYLSGLHDTNALFTFDLPDMRLERHTVLRNDACRRCAQGPPAMPAPVERLEEGTRLEPEELLRRFGHLASPVTGIAAPVEPYGAEAPGVAAACSARYLFLPDANSRELTRRMTSGKGATRAEAAASALGETLERYSGVYRGSEKTRRARYRDLEHDAVHPSQLLHYSDEQYRNREATNREARPEQWIPAPFDEERETDWAPVWSLTQRRYRWVPAAYCYYGYPLPPDHIFCAADSNGCAAGGSPGEAAFRGLLELVERDAVALWWYNRIPRTAVASETAAQFQNYYASLGRCLRLFDITSDLGVPVCAAISWRAGEDRDLILGFGAALDAAHAAQRALTEMNQFLDLNGGTAPRCRLGPDGNDRAFLMENCATQHRCAAHVRDAEALLAELHSRGIEVLALDQTRAGVGLPVVRVIAPGLRHFWPRLGPGRLYTVPVQMGWRSAATPEPDLNRTAFFC